MQVPIAKLLGFDNQLLNMSCQTGDYNFSSYGTWRPSGFRTEGKMGTQTFSIVSENRNKKFQTANLAQKTAPSTVYFADRA